MTTLSAKLNFSTKPESVSAISLFSRGRDLGYYYDNLCLYCANNNIDLSETDDADFDSAAQILYEFGSNDFSTDRFLFWID